MGASALLELDGRRSAVSVRERLGVIEPCDAIKPRADVLRMKRRARADFENNADGVKRLPRDGTGPADVVRAHREVIARTDRDLSKRV